MGKGKEKDTKGSEDRVCFYCQKKGHVKADCRKLIQDKKKSGGTGQHKLSIKEDWQQALGGDAEDIAWIFVLGQELNELDGVEHEPVIILVDSGASASACLCCTHQSRRPERS